MNHETEYDTDFNPERYANKLILCDGAILALLSVVVVGIYLASL